MVDTVRATPSAGYPSEHENHSFAPRKVYPAPALSRPNLKRQTTAPAFTQREPKKLRIFGVGNQDIWSEDEHAALLEGLRLYPLGPVGSSCEEEERALNVRLELIKDHIVRETGRTRSVQQILQKSNLFLGMRQQDAKLPHNPNLAQMTLNDPNVVLTPKSPRTMTPFQQNEVTKRSFRPSSVTPSASVSFATATPSMSQRRQASNRPIPSLHVNIPPLQITTSFSHLFHSSSASKSSQSPSSTLWRAPLLTRTNSSTDKSPCPCTPVEQRIRTPLAPPEIPRVIDCNRNAGFRRWAPTPTEDVFPTVSFATVTTSSYAESEDIVMSPSDGASAGSAASSLTWISTLAGRKDSPLPHERDSTSLASPAMIGSPRPFGPCSP